MIAISPLMHRSATLTTKFHRLISTVRVNETIPKGLRLIPNFLSSGQFELHSHSLILDIELNKQASLLPTERAKSYLSKQHNIKSDEYFKRINFSFNDQKITCQHFEAYGEDGHKLSYFIGLENIPPFVKHFLLEPINALPEVKSLREAKKTSLDWNFTFNVYRIPDASPDVVPGFPFHTDLPSNGEITFIYPLMSSATLEMKRERPELHKQLKVGESNHTHDELDPTTKASFTSVLNAGDLLMFSGESRWEWQHRVLPQKVTSNDTNALGERVGAGKIWRISLVLGCR